MKTLAKALFSVLAVVVIWYCFGWVVTIPSRDLQVMRDRSEKVFRGCERSFFVSIPSSGRAKNAFDRMQYAVTGVPNKTARTFASYYNSSSDEQVCLTVAGASSAHAAHMIREAFSVLPAKQTTPKLRLLFVGEPEFGDELEQLVESRGGKFFFEEYYPESDFQLRALLDRWSR